MSAATNETLVLKPWGHEEIVLDRPGMCVKILTIGAGQRLSLQLHHRKREAWFIVAGEGLVTLDKGATVILPRSGMRECVNVAGHRTLRVWPGVVVVIPPSCIHRIEGLTWLEVVETADCLGASDIDRLEDDYDRARGDCTAVACQE